MMLNLPVALPAWTLLEMMAVQTGTVFAMEGDVLVFAKAEKAEEEREVAEDKDGLELPGGSLQGLALLLTGTPLRSGDPDELNVRLATRGTAPIGAGALQVGRVGERVTVSGPVRTLRALEMARRGMESRALVVSSSRRISGSVSSAVARARRWRWPPERLMPPSPISVW